MLKYLVSLVFAAAGWSAAADTTRDVSIKFDQIAPGSSVTYLLPGGERRTHHFEGKTADGYEISYWNGRGKGVDGGIYGIGRFNTSGQMVEFAIAGGPTFTYTPHNCMRVVGSCRYEARRSDGATRTLETLISPTEAGFEIERYAIHGDDRHLEVRADVTLDQMGMMEVLDVTLRQNDAIMENMTQEAADYR